MLDTLPDLTQFAAKEAAIATVYRLFWAIDARRWDALDQVCAGDAVAAWRDLPAGRLAGAIERLFAGLTTHHQVTNPLVELEGEKAEVSALVTARHRRSTLRGADWLVRASRDRLRLRLTEAGWRVTHLFRETGMVEGNPGLLPGGGEALAPAATAPLAHETLPADQGALATALADRLAIHDLMMRFGRGLDSKDWALYRACLADRIVVDFSQSTGRPPAAVDADAFVAFARMRQRHHASFHQYSNFQVQVDGDRARCLLYLVARHRAAQADGDPLNVFVGWYDNEFVRTPSGWRLCVLRHPLQWIEGNAAIKDAPDPEADALGRDLFTVTEAV